METTKYDFVGRLGITDLRGIPSSRVTEWWTEKEWAEAIAKLPEDEEWNKKYIQELKDNGTYGFKYTSTIELVHNPLYDEPKIIIPVTQSDRIIFLDLNQKEDGSDNNHECQD